MSQTARQMSIGMNILGFGAHASAWRKAEVPANAYLDVEYYRNIARISERGCLDAIFLADGPALAGDIAQHPAGRLEPTVLLTAVALATRHIGVIATASSSYNDPFNLARRFSSLDHISGGRAAWNVVTSWDAFTGENFRRGGYLDYSDRYQQHFTLGSDISTRDRDGIHKTFSGILTAPFRLLVSHGRGKPRERGALLIKIGLIIYDTFSRDGGAVPRHRFHGRKKSHELFPDLDERFAYTATYYDASMHDPERLALDVLRDGLREESARAANYAPVVGSDGSSVIIRDELKETMRQGANVPSRRGHEGKD